MTKRHKRIPENLKSKILTAALMPGCRVADLAKTYGIAAWTIYTWRKEMAAKSNDTDTATKFVELEVAIDENTNLSTTPAPSDIQSSISNSPSTLQKASLTFKHFSCVLEGRISTSTILKVIKIMDEEESVL